MMKEIGGYFELEKFTGEEYHSELIRLNLGRTAVLLLVKALEIKTLWMPYFLCESVTSLCERHGIAMKFYHVDEQMQPVITEPLQDAEYLYIVNYYGIFDTKQIREFQDIYGRVIVDNTHHFFQRPVCGVPTIYSVRKYFGVSDGAYVTTGDEQVDKKVLASLEELQMDCSGERMKHILGRYEKDAGTYYQDMLKNAHTYDHEELKCMSKLTQNLLRGIDYDLAQKKREENWKVLHDSLCEINGRKFPMGEGPFMYAFYCNNGMAVRKRMAAQKIFVPTYWSNVIQNMPEDSLEYDFAANIMPIPCDQRYDAEDMRHVVEVLMECMQFENL